MCNEFALERSLEELLSQFDQLNLPLTWDGGAPNMEPRPSIRPTDPSYIIVGREGGAELTQLRWGFVNRRFTRFPITRPKAVHEIGEAVPRPRAFTHSAPGR